jgi:hypothetical protein
LKAEKEKFKRVRSKKSKKKSPCKQCDFHRGKLEKNIKKLQGHVTQKEKKSQDWNELKREELVTAGVSTRSQADKPIHSDQDQAEENSEIPNEKGRESNENGTILLSPQQLLTIRASANAGSDTEKPATEEQYICMEEEEDKTEQSHNERQKISCMANWLQKTYQEKRSAIEELFKEDGKDYEGFEEEELQEDDTGKESRPEVEEVTERQNERPTAGEALEKPDGVEAEAEKKTESTRSAEMASIEKEECELEGAEEGEKDEEGDEKESEDEEVEEEGYEGGTEADTAEDSENERDRAQEMLDSSDCSTVALEDVARLGSDGEMIYDW